MKRLFAHLFCLLAVVAAAAAAAAADKPPEAMPVREAMKLASDYMLNLRPEMQILELRARDGKSPLPTRVVSVPDNSTSRPQISPLHHVACMEGGTYIILAFKHPPLPDADLEELQANLAGVWTPLVTVPEVKAKGWHVRINPSGDSDKVRQTVLNSFEDGVLRFRLTTTVWGVEGEMDAAEGAGRNVVVNVGQGPQFVRTDNRDLVVPDDKYFMIEKQYLFGLDVACRLFPENQGVAAPAAAGQGKPPSAAR